MLLSIRIQTLVLRIKLQGLELFESPTTVSSELCPTLNCVLHVSVLPRTYLLNVSIIGPVDELFKLSQAVGLGQCKDQLCFNV